ncbi:PucR family transcriptional regulator [Nocardia sp. NPDC051750]|uniref:PucR family transcriptional regulator n=1 Tax=Nocardia sp. NPDC051750 TaxID=3364325 RepID=UPI0037B94F2A
MSGPTRYAGSGTETRRHHRHQDASEELARSLLSPPRAAAAARVAGYAYMDRYGVIAVTPCPADPPRRHRDTPDHAAVIERIRAELLLDGPDPLPAQLGPERNTILIPGMGRHARCAEELLIQLSDAADATLLAAVVHAETAQVPAAAELAHELLEVAVRLGHRPGLYRWEDLALEYHITRPGPAFDHLGALLEPLASHPHLLDTLGHHLDTGFQPRRTAGRLGLHVNTVRHRLERTHQLIGLDPLRPQDGWLLRSALIARRFLLGGNTIPVGEKFGNGTDFTDSFNYEPNSDTLLHQRYR